MATVKTVGQQWLGYGLGTLGFGWCGPPWGTTTGMCVQYNGTYWVVGVSGAATYYSSELSGWTAGGSLPTTIMRGLCWAGGSISKWIAVGASGAVATAPSQPTAWTARTNPLGTATGYNARYGNGYAVITGSGGALARSTDGIAWGSLISTGLTGTIAGVDTDGAGVWVVVDGTSGAMKRSTDNAATWGAVTSPFNSGAGSVVYGANGVWVASDYAGNISRSTDNGVTWSTKTHPFTGNYAVTAQWGGHNWLAIQAAPNYGTAISSDGSSWSTTGMQPNYFGANNQNGFWSDKTHDLFVGIGGSSGYLFVTASKMYQDFASSNYVVSTGWTNPTYAYADDSTYATGSPPGKSTSNTHEFGFAAVSESDVPADSTLLGVFAAVEASYSPAVTGSILGHQMRRNSTGTTLGAEVTQASASASLGFQQANGATLTDLRTANELRDRIRITKGNTSSATTGSCDYVSLVVLFDPPVATGLGPSGIASGEALGSVLLERNYATRWYLLDADADLPSIGLDSPKLNETILRLGLSDKGPKAKTITTSTVAGPTAGKQLTDNTRMSIMGHVYMGNPVVLSDGTMYWFEDWTLIRRSAEGHCHRVVGFLTDDSWNGYQGDTSGNAGQSPHAYNDGYGSHAGILGPGGMTVDVGEDYLWFGDMSRLRKYNISTGEVTTVVDLYSLNTDVLGVGPMCFDSDDTHLYFASSGKVYRYTVASNTLDFVAGNGSTDGNSYAEGTGTAAGLGGIAGLCMGANDNELYLASAFSFWGTRGPIGYIRKLSVSSLPGTSSFVAGKGDGTYSEGTGVNAGIVAPGGMFKTSNGDMYFTDYEYLNNFPPPAQVIVNRLRKCTTGGTTSSIAGYGGQTDSDGTGSGAGFWMPGHVGGQRGGSGPLIVLSYRGHTMRSVTTAGVSTRLHGNTGGGFSAPPYWEAASSGGDGPQSWMTPQLAAVTIPASSTLVAHLWGRESNALANAAWRVKLERCDYLGAVISTVADATYGTEIGNTLALQEFTVTTTGSDVTLADGDRLKLTLLIDDGGGNMASGYTVDLKYAQDAANSADSFIGFPSVSISEYSSNRWTSTYYLTDTSLSLSADKYSFTNKRLADVSPGSSATSKVTSTYSAGYNPGPGLPYNAIGGDDPTSHWYGWWTPPLSATTLPRGDQIRCRLWYSAEQAGQKASAGFRATLVDGNGVPKEFVCFWPDVHEMPSGRTAVEFLATVEHDISIADGDRLLLTPMYSEQIAVASKGVGGGIVAGKQYTFWWNGADAASQADSYVQFETQIDPRAPGGGTFTLAATVLRGQSGSFTANAVVRRTITPAGFPLDAMKMVHHGGPGDTHAFALDALLRKTVAKTVALDATLLRTMAGGLAANAVLRKTIAPTGFRLDAWLVRRTTGTLTLDAAKRATVGGTITLDAWKAIHGVGAFTASAVLRRAMAGSFTLAALIDRTQTPTGFKLDAVKRGTVAGSATLNAVIRRQQAGTLALDAVKRGTVAGSATLDAVKRGTAGSSFTLDAEKGDVSVTRYGSLTVNAWLVATRTGTLILEAEVVAVPVLGAFTADSWLTATRAGSFSVAFNWIVPGQPPLAGRAVSRITVGGVDITRHVQWATATFTSKVNGAVGECYFEVRDDARSMEFSFGQEVELWIEGVKRWGGWIQRPRRSFPMPVLPRPLAVPRFWQIEGVDYNAIFDKRVLHDAAHPDRAWDYAPGTWDDTLLHDVWNYFDTEGFTLSVERVGVAVLDIAGVTVKGRGGGLVASGGFSMRDVFTAVARNTAAVFYCSPDRVVTYVDSETVTNPTVLTDQPYAGGNVAGYREMKIREDSTEMCNDGMAWGAGYTSPRLVFARHQDAASQAAHGRWQKGVFTSGVYKQATVNALAASYVEGSPAAHRAQKHPKRAVELVTRHPMFGAGDVVTIHNSSFEFPDPVNGHDDVLPIRRMTVTFPTPWQPRFALQLSWEIDMDWAMHDPWIPPGYRGGGDPPPPPPEDPTATAVHWDDFDREIPAQSFSSPPYEGWGNAPNFAKLMGSVGDYQPYERDGPGQSWGAFPPVWVSSVGVTGGAAWISEDPLYSFPSYMTPTNFYKGLPDAVLWEADDPQADAVKMAGESTVTVRFRFNLVPSGTQIGDAADSCLTLSVGNWYQSTYNGQTRHWDAGAGHYVFDGNGTYDPNYWQSGLHCGVQISANPDCSPPERLNQHAGGCVFVTGARITDFGYIVTDPAEGGDPTYGGWLDGQHRTDWATDTWYLLKVHHDPSQSLSQVKCWQDGTAEPGWQASAVNGTAGHVEEIWEWQQMAPVEYIDHREDQSDSRVLASSLLEIDWVDIQSGGGSAGTVSVHGVGISAYEPLVTSATPVAGHYPSGSTWRTAQASYVPGSTMLLLDGVSHFTPTGLYSESDPAAGEVVIDLDVDVGADVRLSYLTNGPLP